MALKIKALLVAALVCSLLFQGQGDGRPNPFCCYGSCTHHCIKNNIDLPKVCHSNCAKRCNLPVADAALNNEMGVAVAAGGGNLGKGNHGTETGALGSACHRYYRCLIGSRNHVPGTPAACYPICMNNVADDGFNTPPKLDDLASHEMSVAVAAGGGNLGKGNNGTETGGAAP